MTLAVDTTQDAFALNELKEVISKFEQGKEVEYTSSSGRKYTIVAKRQNEAGEWIFERFPMTVGKCETCKQMYSGVFTGVWHGENHAVINSKLMHSFYSHPDTIKVTDDLRCVFAKEQ